MSLLTEDEAGDQWRRKISAGRGGVGWEDDDGYDTPNIITHPGIVTEATPRVAVTTTPEIDVNTNVSGDPLNSSEKGCGCNVTVNCCSTCGAPMHPNPPVPARGIRRDSNLGHPSQPSIPQPTSKLGRISGLNIFRDPTITLFGTRGFAVTPDESEGAEPQESTPRVPAELVFKPSIEEVRDLIYGGLTERIQKFFGWGKNNVLSELHGRFTGRGMSTAQLVKVVDVMVQFVDEHEERFWELGLSNEHTQLAEILRTGWLVIAGDWQKVSDAHTSQGPPQEINFSQKLLTDAYKQQYFKGSVFHEMLHLLKFSEFNAYVTQNIFGPPVEKGTPMNSKEVMDSVCKKEGKPPVAYQGGYGGVVISSLYVVDVEEGHAWRAVNGKRGKYLGQTNDIRIHKEFWTCW